mmetsp:Transcript_38492/g.28325  ORF Transcript_38492/g.28325 Transcript_38492/m.28325 type:complete len:97 (-) Transcript_38492:370-660(-)
MISVPIDKDALISYGFMCFCKRVETDNGSIQIMLRQRKSIIPEYEIVQGNKVLCIDSFPPPYRQFSHGSVDLGLKIEAVELERDPMKKSPSQAKAS